MDQKYFKTSERPPTAADGNAAGTVLAWMSSSMWAGMSVQTIRSFPDKYPYWQPQPPDPVSEEEEAFEKWVKGELYPSQTHSAYTAARAGWTAALEYAAKEKQK